MTVQVVRPYRDVEEEWNVDWTGVADLVESLFDKCHLVGNCNGATWHPSVCWLWKNFMDSTGVESMTFGHGEESWKGWATSPPTVVLNTLCSNKLFELNWSLF
jgi:hypothetical protein